MQVCPNCQEENPDRFRLCGFCGTPLAGALPPLQVRKTVTIVFSDLKGSTSLGERLDSETLREVMERYFQAMRAELERHGGTIEKYIGDAVMAVFGLPTIHEDDALRAIRAAAGMQRALATLNDALETTYGVRLTNRTGVNTGEVVAGDPSVSQHLVVGDAVNTAARLEQAAPANEVLLGELTFRLVRDAIEAEPVEPLELKGKADRVRAWRLLGLRTPGPATYIDAAPMVGRARELAALRAAFWEAVEDVAPRLVTVTGEAGVGKSRLIRAFLDSLSDDALVLRGRCLNYGDGITFWPIVEIVRQAAGVRDDDTTEQAVQRVRELLGDEPVAERIASATGMSAAGFPLPELFWGIRRFLEILGVRRPLVIVVDDIHWAEATLLDLIEHLVGSDLGIPALFLCTSRHVLHDSRAGWAELPGSLVLPLGRLSDADAAAMVDAMLGQAGVADALRARLIDATEGNPLFLEQMISMLRDDGLLRLDAGRWVAATDLGAVEVPPTIQALLDARLDALSREDRAVAEPAAVIGLVFAEPAVTALAPAQVQASVPERLASLGKKQFVLPAPAGAPDDYRFCHILIRDAAYRGLLKRARATLHRQYVDWFESADRGHGRELEYEEILGYHLEQAYGYLSELGTLDQDGVALGLRAAEKLASAGRRAFARGDMPAAANLLRRASALVPRATRLRIAVLIEAGEALTEAGELSAADTVLDAAIDESGELGDDALQATAGLGRLYLHYITEGEQPDRATIDEVARAIEVLSAADDHRGLARAWRILTNVHYAGCRYVEAEAAARQMIEHARQAGDRAMELRVLPALATCAQLGPTPVPEALAIAQGVLAALENDRKSEAYTLRAMANLEAMRGAFDEARSLYRRSRATLDELGWRFDAALTAAIASGPVELMAGDPEAAEAELRRDYDALAAMGERNYISTTAAFLAEALYRQGRHDEAFRLTEASEELAAADDVSTHVLWRGVRSKVLAQRGQLVDAEALAHEAVRIIGSAEDPDGQGTAMLDLAEVLRLAGRDREAARAAREAAALFELKGDLISAARARALVDQVAPAGRHTGRASAAAGNAGNGVKAAR